MTKVMVVDDEASARQRLMRLLGGLGGAEVVGECADGASALTMAGRLRPEVIFLDIEMPEGDGLEVAERLSKPGGPLIVFVTAFDQYAVRAFDVHATDYLLKPVSESRLGATWTRVRQQLAGGDAGSSRVLAALDELRQSRGRAFRDRILVTSDGRTTVVSARDIEWIEAAANYVKLHVGRVAHTLREPLSALETQLDPRQFARVHRSAIVNLDSIREIQPWFSGDQVIILKSGAKLKLSRTYRKAFEDRFAPDQATSHS